MDVELKPQLPRFAGMGVLAITILAFAVRSGESSVPDGGPGDPVTGRSLYDAACAACHGSDGSGMPQSHVGFDLPLPDFTDCSFASREPAADWVAVSHDGGPVRGFSQLMPAFGEALSVQELERIIEYVGSLCENDLWPRGELNLPRALVTEKAYPEDEAVFTSSIDAEGRGNITSKVVYEKRFGSRNQIEVVVPFTTAQQGGGGQSGGWTSGLGDVAVGFKRAFYHNVDQGTIASFTGEVVLPTGDESDGFGKGTTVFEPFATFGQILPGDAFVQAQAGLELPWDTDRAGNEGFWRVVVGKSVTQGSWGRTWSPMLGLLGARELEGSAPTSWDLVPQVQITLNTRQHIMANVGVRLPLTDPDTRTSQVMFYILWDWFDGGLFDGW